MTGPPRLRTPWTGRGPRGILVLGMHRSGTSAATRLVNAMGPALCDPGDMVRGPWNPSGHWESRSLMHLNDNLLRQMGRTWWYPPPAGESYPPLPGDTYAAVADAVTTRPAQARRAFRRVHHGVPWVWKDPRTSVLVPFWRAALGPRLAAVVVFRNPLDVAVSLGRRHGVSVSFGVALWERYNRLLLTHAAGLPVLVTRYDDLVADPAGWSQSTKEFLAGVGTKLRGSVDSALSAGFVDPGLRHSAHTRGQIAEGAEVPPGALALYDALEAVSGPSAAFVPPVLGPEPVSVEAELATVGPERKLDWRPPPWAVPGDGAPSEERGVGGG